MQNTLAASADIHVPNFKLSRVLGRAEDPEVIRKILGHLGLATKPPRAHQSRGPPPEAVEPIDFDTSDMVQSHPFFD